jgi:uncharacterized beta-barrel protein YwiB (DUF1934 family)
MDSMMKGWQASLVTWSEDFAEVTISINRQERGTNPESSQQVFVTGRLAERGGKFYAVYEEPPSTGLEGTRTTIKWTLTESCC